MYFQIDIEKSLEDQGPFDMILHKFTDILVKSQQGYITEQRIMRSIEVNINERIGLILGWNIFAVQKYRKLLQSHW